MENLVESNVEVRKVDLTFNEIAQKLLNEKLLLTALELHIELCEMGKELPVLRDFFSNNNNFENVIKSPEIYNIARSSSQVTLDSLDMTRYSEDGCVGAADERVAVLEFELRKAKENISALRANLTVITEAESGSPDKKNNDTKVSIEDIKPHEQKAINFLINEYLMAQSYKLTSITFSDENENQDFDDWNDVGLNVCQPPNLLEIYRGFFRKNGLEKLESISVDIQTDDCQSEELENLQKQLLHLQKQLEAVDQQNFNLEKSKIELEQHLFNLENSKNSCNDKNKIYNSTISDKFELLETPKELISEELDEEDDSTSAVISLGDTDLSEKEWTRVPQIDTESSASPMIIDNNSCRSISDQFRKAILNQCCMTDLLLNDDLIISNDTAENCKSLINLLNKILPIVSPNIVVNKRDEIIPLILMAIGLNVEANERDKLIQLLFSLKKRPQDDERKVLLNNLISLIKREGVPPEPEDILNVCWEQCQHKYVEKRLLAIECCSAIAPYTSNSVKNSLIIPMLQQLLLDDKESVIRSAVIRSLTFLIALTDDPDKYFQCEELALTALEDKSSDVYQISSTLLLPTLAQWALSLNRLLTHLLTRILTNIKNQLKSNQKLPNKDTRPDPERIIRLINVLQILLPHTIVAIINNNVIKSRITDEISSELPKELLSLSQSAITNPLVFSDDPKLVSKLYNTFLRINFDDTKWPELDWILEKLIVDVIEMIKSVNLCDPTYETILNSLFNYLKLLYIGLGKKLVKLKIKPLIENEIIKLEKQLMSIINDDVDDSSYINCLGLIPMYLLILTYLINEDDTVNNEEFLKIIKNFVVIFSMNGINITSLINTIKILLKLEPFIVDDVITALWDGVVHHRPIVRSVTTKLFTNIICDINQKLITNRLAPAIITLASDSDVTVKSSAINALGKLITDCAIKEVKDKSLLTLETIVKESEEIPQALIIPLVSTLTSIAPNSPQRFLDDLIVTQIMKFTCETLQQTRKIELANALIDSYSILVYCPLNHQSISHFLIPGLKFLESFIQISIPHQKDHVKMLIKKAESKQESSNTLERSTSISSGLSLPGNVGQSVDDMRQRMTKIFTSPKVNTSMSSIFKKK